ncbi:Vacuolar protein-sorting-associated protein [Drechslerella dactyloides]|uniref:Vacuolar protein sorting-associated protein n=1 Tax=Drechslerella dactyloides TaxID=74499 RepID=A0AAD6J2U4_DREDA|nr:Vacuolar protein-sorting-associated protein [Drechslerella dactyloides]
MLEGLVATLLNRFLGMYVIQPKMATLKIEECLSKLTVILAAMLSYGISNYALDQMKLPLNVSEGHLGRLTLKIPWSNLKNKPVKVTIEDVFLLATPKQDSEYDEDDEERRRQTLKLEKLESAELVHERTTSGLSEEEQQKHQSFTESLVTKIVDNLQVTIKNIHIRYEDSISAPGHPFALGFTLEEFSAVSTDENWQPIFIQGNVATTHKLGKLSSLAIYWNTDTTLLGGGPHEDILTEFPRLIAKQNQPSENQQFVLKPVSGEARLELCKTPSHDTPKLKARMLFDEIGFVLDEHQYRDSLMLIDLFHFYIRHQQYKKFRPKVTLKEDTRAWLRFAITAVRNEIHEKNKKWTWGYFKERRDDRLKYIRLFKKKKKSEPLPPNEAEDLKKLEWKLSYEDLRFYRSLARNQLRKERVVVKKPQQQQPQGWLAWAWGAAPAAASTEAADDATMTEQQRQELYDAIDWDEKKSLAESIDLPRDSIKMELEACLETGSFTLKRNPHSTEATEIVSLLFDDFKSAFVQRPDSFLSEISLGGLRVYDGTTTGSLFPQIVRVKGIDSDPSTDKPDVHMQGTRFNDSGAFFHATFERNPLDESADSAVTAKLRSMEVIYNPRFLEEIYRFFKPPERHMESIGALMETAGATVEAVRQQTRAGLEFALEEHKTINAKLDLQAPLLVIPENVTTHAANCLVIDAGHVSLVSDLVQKDAVQQIQAKQSTQYTEADYEKLESLMYDKFLLQLHATQILIGPSVEETIAQLSEENDTKQLHIVDRINIDFTVEISILPKAPNLTKFRISGHLPVLHASVSDRKYKTLMGIIDVAVPKFEDSDTEKKMSTEQIVKKSAKKPEQVPRDSRFRFSAQEQALLIVDEDSDDSSQGEDDFTEASEGNFSDAPKIHQKTFEFWFRVDRLQGSLFKAESDAQKPDRPLAELVANGFMLNFYVRPYEIVADVVLKTLNLEDQIDKDPSPEFKSIVTSENSENNAQSLIHIKYAKVNKNSPEYMTVYEGIDTNVDVSISTINVIITRTTLLTLLDFVVTTFTNQEEQQPATSPAISDQGLSSGESSDNELVERDLHPDKIRVKIDLSTIALILNNDGLRLATLSLASADIGIFLMGKTMRIGARLGNFSLLDDINEGAGKDSKLRQLMTIDGDNLADFRYETFDPEQSTAYPGYDTSIYLKSGSIRVNFVEEPFRKIVNFMVKFGRMQALFNAARQAAVNQANQMQQRANRIQFDITIQTPIITFPRAPRSDRIGMDTITAFLGEIYASNKFCPLDDSRSSVVVNKIEAGIRKVKLISALHFSTDVIEELEMIDKIDLGFSINYLEHQDNLERPDIEIQGSMSDLKMKLSQSQLQILVDLSRSIPAVFAADPEEAVPTDFPDFDEPIPLGDPNPTAQPSESRISVPSSDLHPELAVVSGIWTKMDLILTMGDISLELLLSLPSEPITDTAAASLSKFSLNKTKIKLRMMSDGSMESEVLIQSFTINDSRRKESNKYRRIMSSTITDGSQFMASITISGQTERHLIVMLTIDSPRIIFALDYLFALRDFILTGIGMNDTNPVDQVISSTEVSSGDDTSSESEEQSQLDSRRQQVPIPPPPKQNTENQMTTSFRINIVDAQVILIAHPESSSSEAIVLGTKQVLVAQQNALTLEVSKVGMFLCRMDKFETTRLRILDDFGAKASMETRPVGDGQSITSVSVNTEPLVLRVSLRDIMLAMQIVSKASELSSTRTPQEQVDVPKQITKRPRASSSARKSTMGRSITGSKMKIQASNATSPNIQAKESSLSSMILNKEEMVVAIDGFRVILIGDTHELPLLDLSIKHFTARNLNPEGGSGVVGVKLEDTPFESITKIPVNREGEETYALRPRANKIIHRLLCEVHLGTDNVKYITFRSPLLIENNTQIPIELGILDSTRAHVARLYKIKPGDARPFPVEAAYYNSAVVRPDAGFGYHWSDGRIYWEDLRGAPTQMLTCMNEEEAAPPFYFHMHANFDKTDPLIRYQDDPRADLSTLPPLTLLARKYPYMRVRLSAPVEIENLLPYDFKYRIYDRNTKKDWTNFLRKGGLSPVHVVQLSHLLLMSIEMQDSGKATVIKKCDNPELTILAFDQSEYAIINSANSDDFKRETSLSLKDNHELSLKLRLHYYPIPNAGGAFRVSVYSPFLLLNKTGLEIFVKAKSSMQQARPAAGQSFSDVSNRKKALPYMFSYPTDDRRNRALLKIGDSAWSRPVSFEAIGNIDDVVIASSSKQEEIHIGISVTEGEGKYKMTKIVTLTPRFIINSKLSEEINVRELASNRIMSVKPGDLLPLHFLRQTHEKQLTLCFPGFNNQWTSPFNISDVGTIHVKISKSDRKQRLVRIEILQEHATIFLHISMETKSWPFSMRNESDAEFTFWQADPHIDEDDDSSNNDTNFRPIRYRLPPRSIMPYAWDFPAAKKKELILSSNGKERHIRLSEIGNLIPMKIPAKPGGSQLKIIDINVAADGPTQTLILCNYKQSKSIYKPKPNTSQTSMSSSSASGFEVQEEDGEVSFKTQVRFAGIGISLINSHLKELAYVTFRGMELKYNESNIYQTINLVVKWIQIDNQLYGGIFPILLYPSVVPKTGKEMDVHPSFHTAVTRVKDDSYGVLYIKYATFLLQQMTVEIDEDFIFALLDFSRIPGASWAQEGEDILCDNSLDIPEPKTTEAGQDVYFELLHIQPAQMDLSFVRTERINAEDKTSSRNPLMFFANVLTMAIGNINDAPVKLNSLLLENVRVSVPILLQRVQDHYSQEFLYQVHKILGSADFLGNPVGLFNNISSGVMDIFYEPYQGFVMTDRPQELGIGIAKGATSFVKKSVFGLSDSLSKVTGSISKGLSAATLDKQFQDRRRMTRSRNRPKHALYGVTSGANSFITSVASGVGGLARKPLEGAEREGVAGFIKGFGKGVVGLATKPAIGVFDLASNVTEGIRNTTTVFDAEGLERVRLTRFVGRDGIVRPYSQREALGQFWLKQLDNGKYFDEDYIAHLELPGEDVVVMLTYSRIMLVKSKKLVCEWDVPLKDLQTISMEKTGISLSLRGGVTGPFIPCTDTSRQFLYNKIALAVNNFNAKNQEIV